MANTPALRIGRRSWLFRANDTASTILAILILFAIGTSTARAQQATISLNSGSSAPGGTAHLNVSLASGGTQVSAVQWTMTYSPSDVASISVATGPAASAAGKTIACSSTTSSTTCIAYGMNQNSISDGVVATLSFGIALGTLNSSTTVQVTGLSASSASATQINASGSGGTVSISQPLGVTTSCNPATVTLPGTSTCTGTLSGTASSTLWSEASGPAPVTFGNASALSTTVSFPQSGTYALTLTATSGSASSSSNVTITVNPAATPPSGPFSLWQSTATPTVPSAQDGTSVELGVKFRSDSAGFITGIRFYKGSLNTGTHTGQLWTSTGTLLAQGVFTNESPSGWQQLNFGAPVAIAANTTYVAAYHTTSGHFAYDLNYFTSTTIDSPPLHGLRNGFDGPNGVYMYSPVPVFPQNTYAAANYWVDVVFSLTNPTQTGPPPANCPCTIWAPSAVPSSIDSGPGLPVELGVKFQSDTNGLITGVRFYKSSNNTGTHVGNLWSSTGTLLATATFSDESTSGWQQVNFSNPVPIAANTIYVASYHTNVSHFSFDPNAFANAGVDNPPLHALANGVSGGDGVYAYSSSSVFPTNTFQAGNYWVDVVFQ